MARPSAELINILRITAEQIQKTHLYQWGHMGACNCGFLTQQVTHLTKGEIHARALQRHGDWNEQLNDYCPTSGLLFDEVITELLNVGFDVDDLKHLETLTSPDVLALLHRPLQRNKKDDVVLYIHTWATSLEQQLISTIRIPSTLLYRAEGAGA